jgi:hypothetical protein
MIKESQPHVTPTAASRLVEMASSTRAPMRPVMIREGQPLATTIVLYLSAVMA